MAMGRLLGWRPTTFVPEPQYTNIAERLIGVPRRQRSVTSSFLILLALGHGRRAGETLRVAEQVAKHVAEEWKVF